MISAYAPTLTNVVNETAKSVLGPKHRIHQDWFDDNDEQITQLLEEKKKAPSSLGRTTTVRRSKKTGTST